MKKQTSNRVRGAGSRAHTRARRHGSVGTTFALCLGSLTVIGLVIQMVPGSLPNPFAALFGEETSIEFLTSPVERGPFIHTILERGEVESSSNVEVRCQVSGRGSSGVNIIEIVPEGTWVEKGDFLVRLDDSGLQKELIQQQIVGSNSESAMIEAQATLDSAKLELDEYAEGTYKEQLEQLQSAVFVAEENMRRAEEYLAYSKRLAERGYIPEAQLEADSFAVEKAKKELGVAETKLSVLQNFTREKMMTKFRADIQTAEARLQARTKTWELDKVQLQEIETQIEHCTITAPVAGQVVYANGRSKRSSSSAIIEEGMPVRERQTIIQLPDPKRMRVIAKVHESRIGSVRPGLMANLMLDAMPDLSLVGRVTEVSEYPLPSISVYMDHVKEYAVEIEIENPPLGLRPGMTAEVNVMVEQIDDALRIPIEAIIERDEDFYCGVSRPDGTIETRVIKVGSVNDIEAVIERGLSEQEQVVLNLGDPELQEMLDLPEEST
tara:strand:+ start:18339 stop:19823 length:1485 start_codon:yes stop_codon:yes gene_type:complete